MELKLELDTPVVRVAVASPLIFLQWKRTPTIEAARELSEVYRRLLAGSSKSWMILTLASGSLSAPDAATREAIGKEIKTIEHAITGVAMAMEGSGFGVAAIRAIASSIYIVTRPPYPVKVFATTAESTQWLHAQWPESAGAKPTLRELESAVARIRA